MRHLLSAPLLLLCLGAAPAAGGSPPLSPAARSHLDEGFRELADLDYARSRSAFRRIIELEPDNPFGYLLEAGALWWQASQEYGLFQSSPTLGDIFERDIDEALDKTAAYIDSRDPQLRASGYFISGMALGTRGQRSLLKRDYLAAYFDGKKAVRHLKKCLKIDENYADAYLGLGVFDYQAARFSGIARLGGILLGLGGNQTRGLERIRFAMEHADVFGRQAAQFLVAIELSDLREEVRALRTIERLRRDFPTSVYYLFLEALVCDRLGDHRRSVALARRIERKAAEDPGAFLRKELTLACGLSGAACLSPEDGQALLRWTERALELSKEDQAGPFRPWVRSLRGLALDMLGRREEALTEYRRVLQSSFAPHDARRRAHDCLAEPCSRETLLQDLRARSRLE